MRRFAIPILVTLTLSMCGCGLDSVKPWLGPDSIITTSTNLEGSWDVVGSSELFGSTEYSIQNKKTHGASWRCNYLVHIRPKKANTDAKFVFRAFLHEIKGIQFLQIARFSHWHEEIMSLASRPTFSLWRVEYDKENILLSLFGGKDFLADLKSIKDVNRKPLFVDSLENNQKALSAWCQSYWDKEEKERLSPSGIFLTRQGTDFVMPAGVDKHAPLQYSKWKKIRSEQSPTGDVLKAAPEE